MRCVIALICVAAQAGAATANWLKLDTPRFQILSQTTEADLRALAGQLETAAAILGALESGAGRSSNSVRVFIFASRHDFERYGANRKAIETGYYHSGAGGERIAFLHAGPSSRSVILHEYAHLAVHRAGGRMPSWLDEGLAELYATIQIRGKQVLWGGPASWRLPAIAHGQLLDAREFFETDQDSIHQTDSSTRLFYAQSWAFTHMLQFESGYAGGLVDFRKLLGQNMPEADAFERAFGKSRAAALAELPFYLRAGRFKEQPLPVAPPQPFVSGRASRCSREEASYALADLLLHLGRTDEARRIYEELSRVHGFNAEAVKLLGDLALAQDRPEEARLHYQRALDMGSKDAGLHFEYAMLLRDAGASPDRVRGLLELALELDPNLPGLHQFLGNRALDEGDHKLAVERFSGATLLQPEKPGALARSGLCSPCRGESRSCPRSGPAICKTHAGRNAVAHCGGGSRGVGGAGGPSAGQFRAEDDRAGELEEPAGKSPVGRHAGANRLRRRLRKAALEVSRKDGSAFDQRSAQSCPSQHAEREQGVSLRRFR